jgi:hypothetical protein
LTATVLKVLWALPASALGAALGLALLPFGARVSRHTGVLEFHLGGPRRHAGAGDERRPPRVRRPWPFTAITFGHVVLAASPEERARLRRHERVHVAQYERWGPLFLLAYPAESLWQWLRGRRPYLDNRFEREARRVAGD